MSKNNRALAPILFSILTKCQALCDYWIHTGAQVLVDHTAWNKQQKGRQQHGAKRRRPASHAVCHDVTSFLHILFLFSLLLDWLSRLPSLLKKMSLIQKASLFAVIYCKSEGYIKWPFLLKHHLSHFLPDKALIICKSAFYNHQASSTTAKQLVLVSLRCP